MIEQFNVLGFFGGLGNTEIIVIAALALLVFGGRRIPELANSLGRGLVEFKKGLKGIQEDVDKAGSETTDKPNSEDSQKS